MEDKSDSCDYSVQGVNTEPLDECLCVLGGGGGC